MKEEECEDLDRFLNVVLVDSNLDENRRMKLASWKEDFARRLDSSFPIEEACSMNKNLGSLWKEKPLVGGDSFSNDEIDDVNVG